MRGAERTLVGQMSLECEPGYLLFYPPGCVHEERQFGEEPLEFICLDFEWPQWPHGMPYLLHDRQGRVQELMRWLISEEQSSYVNRTNYQQIATRMIAAELLRLLESPPENVLAPIYGYIHQNLNQPISLDDLAACAHINKFHLARVFRARTGQTPMAYVRQARLDLAHRLLLESDLPLREIAPRAGFANEYHLSRLLKMRYGRGARELRRSKRYATEPAE